MAAAAAGPGKRRGLQSPVSGALRTNKREPSVKLQYPVSGPEPLGWSEDNRLSISTGKNIYVLEQICDIHNNGLDMVIHRTSVPAPSQSCSLKVGSQEEVNDCKDKFLSAKDPTLTHSLMMDRVFNPEGGALSPLRGFKFTSWSPLSCDINGRCLLASLTLDNRLSIQVNVNRLQWTPVVDLTEVYGEMLCENKYGLAGSDMGAGLKNFSEFQRRHYMQTPVRMEWSNICNTQRVKANNECEDVGTVLLAVLLENGDVVVWQFQIPFLGKDSIISCNTIESGINDPSVLSWWEYEHGSRKMSGLIVGSSKGPVKILPVNLKAVKGYFTLRQPVVLWQEMDQLPVHNIRCISLYHPYQKCSCSLVVAARGTYVFWCLLLISKAGLNVHNSHVTGLHSLPIVSLTANKQTGSFYTCSVDGTIRRLTPTFTEVAVKFEHNLVKLPESIGSVRLHGICLSPNDAYLALVTAEGMNNGLHPVSRTYQVQFITLKTPEEAASRLLESSIHNLFKQVDLLDLVRWKVLTDKQIPPELEEALDHKLHTNPSNYLWRLRLFLYRILFQTLQKGPTEALWRSNHRESKILLCDNSAVACEDNQDPDSGDEAETSTKAKGQLVGKEAAGGLAEEQKEDSSEVQAQERFSQKLEEIQAKIQAVELHLTREHMKRVLGEVYLHTWITENTSVPTRGICDFLTSDPTYDDRTAKVLISHNLKKLTKQTFPEHCSLCKEILPFTDRRKAVCPNGHIWHRCVLTYHACQSLTYRRCLLQDTIARQHVPSDPDWIKRLLQSPCTYCDSPLF
ncbi:general transcription factor 3C polypeptide 4 [Callorhinchus milii]|uniref:Ral transcription factor IIIC subunit 4 n=1 Tax=Callorhinchus milii TaxID=7868 RepID=A0A4W3ISH7_CALMI|nr:general transcription factor 3C polypeptide 4 [Callorhinchus milii]|eukprot:gi/632969162/ref/XP_007900940.1/ PREDICTED: general transcription factor 3C polypeptide 4 [Callorhinchus milii]